MRPQETDWRSRSRDRLGSDARQSRRGRSRRRIAFTVIGPGVVVAVLASVGASALQQSAHLSTLVSIDLRSGKCNWVAIEPKFQRAYVEATAEIVAVRVDPAVESAEFTTVLSLKDGTHGGDEGFAAARIAKSHPLNRRRRFSVSASTFVARPSNTVHDRESGKRVWQIPSAYRVTSSMICGGDGMVFVPRDGNSEPNAKPEVLAFSPGSSDPVWKLDLSAAAGEELLGPVTLDYLEGELLVQCREFIWALDPADGSSRHRWNAVADLDLVWRSGINPTPVSDRDLWMRYGGVQFLMASDTLLVAFDRLTIAIDRRSRRYLWRSRRELRLLIVVDDALLASSPVSDSGDPLPKSSPALVPVGLTSRNR